MHTDPIYTDPLYTGDDPHADEISIDEATRQVEEAVEDEGGLAIMDISKSVGLEMRNAETMSGDDLARARRQTEIELAHVVEDLEKRLIWLVQQLPDRVWPGKNEEARAISKAVARADDPVCEVLDARRRTLEARSSACRGELEAREELDGQRRAAQKDLEIDITKRDLALRERVTHLDLQLRAAELIVANRGVDLGSLKREREERIAFVAQYLAQSFGA
jgi:hypothetical protein